MLQSHPAGPLEMVEPANPTTVIISISSTAYGSDAADITKIKGTEETIETVGKSIIKVKQARYSFRIQ